MYHYLDGAAAWLDFHASMARQALAPGKKILLARTACRRISKGEAALPASWADLAWAASADLSRESLAAGRRSSLPCGPRAGRLAGTISDAA